MADYYEQKNFEMQQLTEKYVKDLTRIWRRLFDTNMCIDKLNKLVEHAKIFYDDLLGQSLQKQADIEAEIKNLQEEAETLRRVLKSPVELPRIGDSDVPLLLQQSEIDKSLIEMREFMRQRREEICELLLEQEGLCDELGEPPRPLLAEPLPTPDEIKDFRRHLENLKEERVERMNKLSVMRREIKNYLQILELQVSKESEDRLLNHRLIKLHRETFLDLQRMKDFYGQQVQEVHDSITNMQKKLESLWDRLNTSPTTRKKFKHYTEYTQRTYDVFYSELQRCETLKSQNIKHYVEKVRQEIVQWWDKTLKSEVQRSRFTNFNSHCYTDDLLVLHEMELEDLKAFYEKNHQIFELFASRKLLWDRMTALEAKASEPGRYNNRGGQLLKEEKERKTIATKLPKIEQQITDLVLSYEQEEQVPFLVYGENILEVMANEWEKKRQDREKLSSARKNGQTPLSRSQLLRTPMSLKNVSTPSIRKTPSTTNLSTMPSSQKRKLNPCGRQTPQAKRSLMYALNSPSIFLKPTTSAASTKKPTPFKSPLKKQRVIATTIRRKSGRQSGNIRKRRSLKNSQKNPSTAPKIRINDCSDEYTDNYTDDAADEAYDSFQKCIEPASRSSIIQTTSSSIVRSSSHMSMRSRRLQQIIVSKEDARQPHLPKPRIQTPSKCSIRENLVTSTILHRTPPGHALAGSNRKLTTKNLPIII